MVKLLQMFIRSTNTAFLPIHCCTLFFFGSQHFANYFKTILKIF